MFICLMIEHVMLGGLLMGSSAAFLGLKPRCIEFVGSLELANHAIFVQFVIQHR